ncbi:ER membrane protein complex subunit 6 [Ceraceosorus bombacis]|uniref:ER membrane protein complex subunit 6 n=2 Tax=Ceraceosorus TaxID=401624 RepID=A0A0P1BQ00_9BASI|nr:hypothetical protein IE81DRAFT_322410 [Ceraceosorus guamensis]PWN43341.1 hypothetical protein IE81DRAFT_322410 [Ceraceosorus guamensis]CEH18351.1 ER membrane protein complex subunit 6 [Ceraceosorus bombacis]
MDATPTQAQLAAARLNPEALQHNTSQLYYVRSILLSVAGSAAGVLGLRTWAGLLVYLSALVLTNILLVLLLANPSRPQAHLHSFALKTNAPTGRAGGSSAGTLALAWVGWLFEGAQEFGFSFVLWWTLWSALVHVYD